MSRRGYLNGVRLLGLKEMRAAAKPGECIACGYPAVPLSAHPDAVRSRKSHGIKRTHRDTCGEPECKAAWFRFWRRDVRNPPKQHHIVTVTGWRALRRQRQSEGATRRYAA